MNLEEVQVLFSDPLYENKKRMNALHMMLMHKCNLFYYENLKIIKFLIDNGVDPAKQDNIG